MTEADGPRFRALMSGLAAGYRQEVSEPWFHFYWLGLRSLSIEDVERAVGRAIETSKFLPAPAELRQLAGEIPVADRAMRAWQAVLYALSSHGYSHGIDFLDAGITNAAVRLIGGWQALCKLPSDEIKWAAKAFEKAYTTVVEHGVEPEQRRPLEGAYDIQDVKRVPVGPESQGQRPALPAANGAATGASRKQVRECVEAIVDRRLPREPDDEEGTTK